MNKPVAWYKKDSNDYLIENNGQPDFQVQEFIEAGYIPLYTHPVKEQEPDLYSEDGFPLWTSPQFKELTDEQLIEEVRKRGYKIRNAEIVKELTDEEIEEVIKTFQLNSLMKNLDYKDFARAILRKAQEK